MEVSSAACPIQCTSHHRLYFCEVSEATHMEHPMGLMALMGINQDIPLTLLTRVEDDSCTEVTMPRRTAVLLTARAPSVERLFLDLVRDPFRNLDGFDGYSFFHVRLYWTSFDMPTSRFHNNGTIEIVNAMVRK